MCSVLQIAVIICLIINSLALENLSLNKSAEMSTQRDANSGAEGAVDGNTADTAGSGSCALTDENYRPEAWWRVDLNGIFAITELKIYLLNTELYRFRSYSIHVTDDLNNWKSTYCTKNTDVTGAQTSPITLDCDAKGRYVTILSDRTKTCVVGSVLNFCAFLQLCEVQVLGCYPGNHSRSCNLTCPVNCRDDLCSIDEGNCYDCKNGYRGEKCENECQAGSFGFKCSEQCTGFCANNDICSHINGACPNGCIGGYMGSVCGTACSQGSYGPNCRETCGNCLTNDACIHTNGSCKSGCATGWDGVLCKTSCQAGRYGMNCVNSCSSNCINTSDCDRFTGTCNGGCNPGWIGNICDMQCGYGKFGINCTATCGNCLHNQTCNYINGLCDDGCDRGWEGNFCNTSCKSYKFGYNCDQNCTRQCRSQQTCNRFNGSCDNGCERGWNGQFCNKTCGYGVYGYNCADRCSGNCKNNDTCDRADGTCGYGCSSGWEGSFCNLTCQNGQYGENCQETCGQCYINSTCEIKNGTCHQGCASGFKGLNCKAECVPGEFGRDCKYNCSGNCFENKHCNLYTGICQEGCNRGWKGTFCNETCEPGTFGYGCNETCGRCLDNSACSRYDGACSPGCEPGWTGYICKTSCADETYGFNCTGQCSGNCKENPCNKVTGKCVTGCSNGWEGEFCIDACSPGKYGADCVQNCSENCKGNKTCSRFDGFCPSGCIAGWEPPFCEQVCGYGTFGEDCSESCGNCFNQTTCDRETGICEDGCLEGFYGDYCTGNATNSPRDQPSDGQSAVAAVVSVVLVLAVIVGVLAALYLLRKRKLQNTKQASHSNQDTQEESAKRKTKFSSFHKKKHSIKKQGSAYANVIFGEHLTIDDEQVEDIEVSNEENTYYNIQSSSLRIPLTDLKSAIVKKSYENNKLFRDEYSSLSASSSANCKAAQLPENMPKNRYKTTFPYDLSRVVLQTKSPNGGDYINANYINGINSTKSYIACQGPKETTLRDHWCMIWQEGVEKIVMLTNIIEKGKKKCDVYWPAVTSDTFTAGEFTITLESEQVYASCTLRKLTLTNTELNESRPVSHFHYTTWPDHGVPDALDIVLFHRQVREMESQGPLLVHCSAGIGRTGTFIALDALIDDCKSTGYINVFEYVQIMRENRMGMIQTLVQYVFVHIAVFEHLRTVTYTMPKDTFADDLLIKQDSQNEDTFNEEFQNIQSMVPEYTENDYQTGLLEKNHSKNISQDILPVEGFAAFLQTSLKGQLDYINAVYLSSYTRHNEFIVSQIPTHDHITDFLRLLLDHGISTVVALLPDTKVVEKVQWMPEGQYHSTLGSIKLQRDSERSIRGGIDERLMTVKRKSLVNKFRILSAHCIHEDDLELTELDAIVQLAVQVKAVAGTQKLRTLVMSKDGAVGCGLFLTLYNAIEQLQIDDEVDICTLVRKLKIRRPQLCTNLMEYKLCYRLVADYLIQTSIYANT